MKPIAYMKTDFGTKFGLPRQSGFVPELRGQIIFEKNYSRPEAFRGIEEFSHLWVLWEFSEAKRPADAWSPTVRPPRLGGNRRIGVFATRSPFRPNPIGLSCVRLDRLHFEKGIAVLSVSGIDLMDGTPIYDIKPYLPSADSHPDASESYTAKTKLHALKVLFPSTLLEQLPEEHRTCVIRILEQDPRPGYSQDPERIYGIQYAGFDIRFRVEGTCLTVTELKHE